MPTRPFMVVLLILLLALSGHVSVVDSPAQDATPAAERGLGSLAADSPGITVDPIAEPSLEEFTAIARFVAVARVSFFPDSGTTPNFLRLMREPLLVYVESGSPLIGISAAAREPAMLIPPVSTQGDELLVIVPGTRRLPLDPGALVAFPIESEEYASFVAGEEATTFLLLAIFSDGDLVTVAALSGENKEVELLDLNLGVATARPVTPPMTLLSRLTFTSIETPVSTTVRHPVLLYVETGTAELRAQNGGIPVRRGTHTYGEPLELIAPEASTTITTGDAVFIRPGIGISLQNVAEESITLMAAEFIAQSTN